MTVITSESAHVSLLPLSLHLVVTIVDDIAFFRATHTFWNNSSHDLDRAAFTFPLPAGCAVSDFGCDFGHRGRFRSITSKVQAREDARFAFEQSAQAKRPTGLLEQNSTEVFTATIGNIAGHARLRTYLTYFGYLRSTLLQKGSTSRDLTLTIPSSIAKRYGVPPPQFQGSGQALRPFLTEYNIHVYHLAQPTFTSNKKIRWEWDSSGGSWLVNYVRMHSPPGDFELCIRTASSSGEGQAFFEATNGTLGHQFAMMITIPPKQIANTKPRAEESDIIFLADRSGSMQDKIGALKKAMNVFLKGLPTERRFNIWCFGSSNNSMWRTSVEYNAQTLKAAENEVSSWSANMGGTELLEALRALDRSLSSTSMVDIIVLTDGQVWDLDSTVGFVKERTEATRGRMRFFALGIGTEVSHGLVEGIAKYGGGYSEVIQGTNPTIYAERLNAMLGAAKVNHISSIQVEVDGRLLSQSTNAFEVVEWNHDGDPIPPATLSSPADLSKIGGFTRTRLFLMYDAVSSPLIDTTPREVCIKEVDPLGFESSIARIQVIRMPNDGVANFIHKAAARALLGDLEFRESWIQMHPGAPDAGSHQEISLTRRHGVHLGCTWGLVSKWTSFFVMETASGRSSDDDPFLDDHDNHQSSRSDHNHNHKDSGDSTAHGAPGKRSMNNRLSDRSKSAREGRKSSRETGSEANKHRANYGSAREVEMMEHGGQDRNPQASPGNNGQEPLSTQKMEATSAHTSAEGYTAPYCPDSHYSEPLNAAPETFADFTSTSNRLVDNDTYLHANQDFAEPPYASVNDQLPPEPEPVLRSDLNIQVPYSVLSNPPTLSAMLDVSSERQAEQKENKRLEYKMEFEMVEGLIEIGKWDGSFEPKDTRRLVGKYWFDWVASNLRVLDDSVLISTIAVLVVLNGDRYRVCDDMIEPLREKAEGFVRKIIEDEEYFNKVFKFATLGYELDVWKQPQAEEGYLQAFHDADTTEQGIESAEIKREGSTPFNREPHTVDAVQAPLSGFGNLNIHDQNSVQDFDDSDPSHTHRQYGNEQPATYDAPATPQPTQLYDRRHSVKTSSSSSRQHDQDRQKTGEKSTTSSRRPWYGPEATRDQVMNLTTDASRDEKKDKTQRTSAPSTSHLDGVSSYKTPHDRYHQRKEFDEMSQDHYHQPYDLTLQPQQDYANNHMQDSSYGNYDRQDLSSTTPPRDYHNDQTTDNCQNYYPQDHGQIAEVYENSQVHNQQNHVHGDDYNQEQNLDHPQAYSRPQSSSYPSQQSPEDTRFSQHSPGDIPRAFPEIPQAKASRDSSRRKQNSHGTGSRSSKNYRA